MLSIEYSNYLPNGEIARSCKIDFVGRNKYRFQNLYEKFISPHYWYTIYDLENNFFTKYKISNDEIIKEGEMSFGKFKPVDQRFEKKISFDSHTNFHGYEAIQFTESMRNVSNRVIALNNNILKEFIDPENVYKIPISVDKRIGQGFKNYGILASSMTDYNGKYITMFEITKISF